ncbi:oligosaccharide flippase family protein, partial [Neobacillus vireti]|uniref:oligosaccharide flippase family protein n=1 Tax=Neobacillus vireti TaxID=220686 RepID=UPI0030003E07
MKFKNLFQRKALKAGMGYTVGNYFLKGISIITIPIFTRLLSTSDYGLYNTYLSYESIIYIILGMALHSSVKNARYEFKGEIDSYISSVSLLAVFNLMIFLIIGNLVSEY